MSRQLINLLFNHIKSFGCYRKILNHQAFLLQFQRNFGSNNYQSGTQSNLKLYDNEREFQTLTVDHFQSIFKSNSKLKAKVTEILNIYELEKYTTQQVSTTLSIEDMKQLLNVFNDEKELRRTLKFFYIRECDKYNSKQKKLIKKREIKEKKIEKYGNNPEWQHGIFGSNGELVYGLWHNSLMSRISKQAIRDYRQNHILRRAAMFGQKLIIDLDYDRHMKQSEINLLAQQVGLLYYENRVNRDYPELMPYDIHFTNCKNGTKSVEALSKHIKRMDHLMDYYFHWDSYLTRPDLFPKKHLIYLSPHAKEPLRHYNHDDIYILGGYNDKSSHLQVTHVKAKNEGIPCYRLPLDENVIWKQGNKNLCLNQVAAILHGVKATDNWQLAIRKFAPQRKVRSAEEQELEDLIRMRAIKKRLINIQRSYRFD